LPSAGPRRAHGLITVLLGAIILVAGLTINAMLQRRD
jgi:hypothetical protein